MIAEAPPPGLQGPIVLERDRHLKWQQLDWLEHAMMVACGVCLACFSAAVFMDVVTRELGRPWLWLQEVTMAFFTYGIFCGTAVATRRQDHLQLSALTDAMHGPMRTVFEVFNRGVVLAVGLAMVGYGWQNFMSGLNSFRMPSMTPIAYLYWPIPVCGALIALFSVEQIVNGLRNGFVQPAPREAESQTPGSLGHESPAHETPVHGAVI